jgi:hypothetical protein
MARQLTLIDSPHSWRLSEATRAAGRKGIAEARAKLQEALARQAEHAESDRSTPATRRTAA